MNKFNFGFQVLRAENTGDNMGESCEGIDSFSKPGKSVAEKAAAELLKEKEEAQVAETKNQLAKDKYIQDLDTITLRRNRANEKAQKEKLVARTAENKSFAAGDVDMKEHHSKLSKINENYDKACDAATREYSDGLDNLRKANPSGYNSYRGW